VRAKQLTAVPTTFLTPEELRDAHDARAIARLELEKRRMPLRLRRPVGVTAAGDQVVEEWNPREMALPQL